nr:hypothetical protein B0A51_00205 [Rachicladosporium sp. CCFEE 5018]
MLLCKCPQLTPLQARFVASFTALCLLGLVFWSLSNPHFAYAAEVDLGEGWAGGEGGDHNWHRIEDDLPEDSGDSGDSDWEELGVLDTEVVIGARQEQLSAIAGNDQANNLNVITGQTTVWRYSKELLQAQHADVGVGLPSALEEGNDGLGPMEARRRELRRRDLEDGEAAILDRRQANTQIPVFISVNTCLQPTYNGTGTQTAGPPQLTLYVSSDNENGTPGPGGDESKQFAVPLDEGFANYTLSTSGDLYMAVHAPDLTSDFAGGWNYDIAVSIDDYYHQANETDPYLYLVDTDTNAALLVTDNLTQADTGSALYDKWTSLSPPFVMFASSSQNTKLMGLSKSFCGMQNNAQIQAQQSDPNATTSHVEMGMITRGLGDKPKQHFYVTSLNGSSTYYGTLAIKGNSTASGTGIVGGGGKVWQPMNWTTKADGNCRLVFNLDFCDKVAYAVPANYETYPDWPNLRALYDSQASNLYNNFSYSLQQTACDTTSDAQYSLARNCSDCEAAYKEWLCAVSIPRCDDWSSEKSYLQKRNMAQPFTNGTSLPSSLLNSNYTPMLGAPTLQGSTAFQQTYLSSFATNQSRNPTIDAQIKPGPYKELLPCEDLCYSLVQSCPAALGFGCPRKGRGLEAGYGVRDVNGDLSCSYLGAVYYLNDARAMCGSAWVAGLVALWAMAALLM